MLQTVLRACRLALPRQDHMQNIPSRAILHRQNVALRQEAEKQLRGRHQSPLQHSYCPAIAWIGRALQWQVRSRRWC